MAIKQKLTPEAFLSAPRRSPAVPSPTGELAFLTVSTHTFGEGTKKEVMLMDVDSGVMWPVSEDNDVSDVAWLPGTNDPHRDEVEVTNDETETEELVWLRKADQGVTEVVVTAAAAADKGGSDDGDGRGSYVAARIPAPVQALKLKRLEDGSVACAVVGLVGEDGGIFNEETATKPPSSGRIFDSVRVREWKTYRNPRKYAIFYSVLVANDHTGKWKLTHPLRNVLLDTDLEAPSEMYQPGDPLDSFDIGQMGITFVARNPLQGNDLTKHDCSNIYFAPIRWSPSSSLRVPALDGDDYESNITPQRIMLQGGDGDLLPSYSDTLDAVAATAEAGTSSCPSFSPDGTVLAFLFAPLKCPADVRLHMAHISCTSDAARADAAFEVFGGLGDALEGFEFAPDGQSVYATVQRCGRMALCEIELRHNAAPKLLHDQGSVSGYFPLGGRAGSGKKGALLVSGSNFVESSFYKVVECGGGVDGNDDGEARFEARVVSTATRAGARFGLDYNKQVGEMWFEGGGDYCVQAWEIRPSDFDHGRKYPVVMMIHGGPASAWMDEWHARWNPAVWAEQGYIVVMPNVTGSTGFGLEHATRIYGQWGGYPYKDLAACMEHLKKIPYIDTNRAVAAGGSYGGYMINWINGQPLGKQFKATVCHDSVFNCVTVDLMSDESSGLSDFAGPALPWENYEELDKWNPAKPERLARWKKYAAPCLVIHGDCDYRCPVTEGFAAFKTLQGLGVESRLLTFPDEGHWVENKENALEWHRVVFEWLNRFSGVEEERGIRDVEDGVDDLLVF